MATFSIGDTRTPCTISLHSGALSRPFLALVLILALIVTPLWILAPAATALPGGVTPVWSPATMPWAGSPRPESWQPPVSGAVLSRFDPPRQRWLPGHRGIDLATRPDEPVRSPTDGVVSFAGTVGGKPVVVVSHGMLRSTLEPVDPLRAVGDVVHTGEVVGVVPPGPSPAHCSAAGCLHWGVRRGEDYVDPLALLGIAAPIVLLPAP